MQQQQPSAKRRRLNTRKACLHCKLAHAGCDANRPCSRCKQKGLDCTDADSAPWLENQSSEIKFVMQDFSSFKPEEKDKIDSKPVVKHDNFSSHEQSSHFLPSSQVYPPVQYQQQQQHVHIPSVSPQQQQHYLTPAEQSIVSHFDDHVIKQLANAFQLPKEESPPSLPPYMLPQQAQVPVEQVLADREQIMSKISNLENYLLQQSNNISKLMTNMTTSNIPAPQDIPSIKVQYPLLEKYKPLLKINCSGISIRDKKTLKLIGCNELYASFFRINQGKLPQSEEESQKVVGDPLLWFIIANVASSPEKNASAISIIRSKFLVGTASRCILIDVTIHFEDEGVLWSEAHIVNPPVWDDYFRIDECVHQSTVRFELPIQDAAKAREMYAEPNKVRMYKMISTFFSIQSQHEQQQPQQHVNL